MGVISAKCTNCGADLELDDSREFAFCQYCGHKLIIASIQKTEHTTVIRDEAEIIRANTEAKELELAEKSRKNAARTKLITKLIKIAVLPLAVLIVYLFISNSGTNYRLVNSTAYTEKAFNITPKQLIDRFLEMDTRSVSEYGLFHTEWIPFDNSEEFFTSNYNTLYHGEHRYCCFFYKPTANNKNEPDTVDDERVYYRLYVQTDNEDRIIYLELTSMFRDQTVSGEKTLNGYFGTTLRGEFFSILSGQKGDFVLKKFKAAEDAWFSKYVDDGKVRYYYEGYSNAKEYSMMLTYSKK